LGSLVVAVVGPSSADPSDLAAAERVGAALAAHSAIVVTGGLGGVMEAASRGAASAGGVVVGLLPGVDRSAANEWVSFALPTGLGELRNGLIVRACDAMIAVGGGYGTLSEIALALKAGKRVVGIGSWDVEGVQQAPDAASAVDLVLATPSPPAG
jgi:hypothetical protein